MDQRGGEPAAGSGGAARPVSDVTAGPDSEIDAELAGWVDEALTLYGDLLPGIAASKAAAEAK